MALRESCWTHGTGVEARCFSLLAFYHEMKQTGTQVFQQKKTFVVPNKTRSRVCPYDLTDRQFKAQGKKKKIVVLCFVGF